MTTKEDGVEFGKLRSFFWPVYAYELKKLLPMLLLFFCILFNYTVLRDTKDALIVTAPGSGAEAIPFLKVYGVLPMAFLFMFVYSKMSNALSKPMLFYATVFPFIIFFSCFPFVYAYRGYLHPNIFCDWALTVLPHGAAGLVAIVRNWTFSLFYIVSELWGSVCLSLLFWGFANDITKVSESKRFYNLFGLGANFSLLLAGTFVVWASDMRRGMAMTVSDPWQVTLNILMVVVVISALAVMAIYWWINKYVLTDVRFYDAEQQKKMQKEKPKLGFLDSLKYIFRSKHMGFIAILVIAYGISINLVEVTWKSQLKLQYPDPNAYSVFMGNFSRIIAVATLLVMFFVTGNAVRNLGWKVTAIITPIVLLLTGFVFFFFMIFDDRLSFVAHFMGTTSLFVSVIFGMLQNVMSKSAKYALFDPTKEMAYIPLDQEKKIKGKAAIDVVGARLGKSGGAFIQQFLILTLGNIAAMAPYVAVLLLVVMLVWMWAINGLDKSLMGFISKEEESKVTA